MQNLAEFPPVRQVRKAFSPVDPGTWQDAAMAPRRVHHLFAHQVLPEAALDPRTDLFGEAEKVDLGPRFVELWEEMNRRAGESEAIDPDGLAAYVVVLPELNGVLVTLPEATQEPEAKYAMLVANDDPTKRLFFTSERGSDPDSGAATSELCAWVPSAAGLQKVNLGRREDPSLDAFVNDVVVAASR